MLQHRGQEGAGAVLSDRVRSIKDFYERRIAKEQDSVKHFFGKFNFTEDEFFMGIAHTRYSTAGSTDKIENVQPLLNTTRFGTIAIAHNGTLPYAPRLREKMEADGESFFSDSDSEVILKLIAHSQKENLVDAIVESLEKISGAFSLLLMTKDQMIVARDPYGFRPLSLATFNDGYMVASESCAFDPLEKSYGVRFLRDVEPGEIVVMGNGKLESIVLPNKVRRAQCIFELIYFGRPDSKIFGIDAHLFRMQLGYRHALEHPIKVDGVVAIPDSSNYFGDGHASSLGIPHLRALVRNHYTGRTFIDPIQSNRSKSIRLKLNPIPSMINGLDISIDDDSIVRGNTSRKIIRMIRGCNPKSITFSASCPPIISHCPYGIDIKEKGELIAAEKTIEEIRSFIEADDLRYLPIETLKTLGGHDYCYGCFDGRYPL
jgi:amidophosphoribosyltransferase